MEQMEQPEPERPEPTDFTIFPILWNAQYNKLQEDVEHYKPDCVVILGIPRHHAKKLAKQDWTKDYYLSKEKTDFTTTNREPRARITIIYSRFPFTSEEWLLLSSSCCAHITEICIPIGGWGRNRSPVEMLQEYELCYDEVSTITLVSSTNPDSMENLRQSFSVDTVQNSIVFITPGEATTKVETDLRLWKQLDSSPLVKLSFDLIV